MAHMKSLDPLGQLMRLNSSVYLREPTTTPAAAAAAAAAAARTGAGVTVENGWLAPRAGTTSPDTVLLFSWMDAAPRYIAKYIAGYATTHPTARLVLVTTDMADLTYRRRAAQMERLKPVVDIVRAVDRPGALTLMHMFSNAGSHTASLFLQAYRDSFAGARTDSALPLHAMIFDSGPGRAEFRRFASAVSVGLPQPWYLRIPALVLVYLILGTLWIPVMRFHRRDTVDRLRQALNDKRLVRPSVPRCYIYSETDALVDWKDVESHGRDAEQKGWIVLREKYDDSPHVGHMRTDVARYWKAVETVIQRGMEPTR